MLLRNVIGRSIRWNRLPSTRFSHTKLTTMSTPTNVQTSATAVSSSSTTTVSSDSPILPSHSHYEFQVPPAFGIEHEEIRFGHEPGSMWHINALQDLLGFVHDNLGIEWWATISLSTILFRFAFLPLNIGLIRNSSRLALIRSDIEENAAILKQKLPSLSPQQETTTEEKDQLVTLDNSKREELLRHMMEQKYMAAKNIEELLKTNKCHPMLNIISPFVMAPMFLSVFLSVERICVHDPTVKTEGMLWFHDLSVMDPTWVLPVFSALTWLISVELGADNPRTIGMQQFRSVLRFLAAVMVPITSPLPSGVFVYWITSNLFSITQILTLQRFSKLRRWLRIPSRDAASKLLDKKPIAL